MEDHRSWSPFFSSTASQSAVTTSSTDSADFNTVRRVHASELSFFPPPSARNTHLSRQTVAIPPIYHTINYPYTTPGSAPTSNPRRPALFGVFGGLDGLARMSTDSLVSLSVSSPRASISDDVEVELELDVAKASWASGVEKRSRKPRTVNGNRVRNTQPGVVPQMVVPGSQPP